MERSDSQAGLSLGRPLSIGWPDVAVLGIALVWGASYPVAKGALLFAPVLVLIFHRFLITGVVMTTIARREIAALSAGDCMRCIVLGAILFAIFAVETAGVLRTSATNTTLIISLCVVFTPILDYGLSREFPPAGILVGAFASCLGVSVLTGGMTALNSGDLLVLGAAVLRAIMVVATKRLLAGRPMSSAALTALQGMTVVTLTLACLLGRGDLSALVVPDAPKFWASIAFLSVFCTIVAFYVQNAAVRHGSPTRVSLIMGFEPLFGCLLAHLLLLEPFSTGSILGAALIIGGTLTGIVFEHRKPQ